MQYATLQSYGQHILNKLGNLRNEENSDQKCLHFLFLHHGILYCQQSAAICRSVEWVIACSVYQRHAYATIIKPRKGL